MKRLLAALVLAAAFTMVATQILYPQIVAAQDEATTVTEITTVGDDAPVVIDDPDTVVTIPYGTVLDAVLANVLGIVGAGIAMVLTWAFRKLPANVVAILRMIQVEQLLSRAAEYGINATRGAVKGKTLDVDVGNQALERALQYALDSASRGLIEFMGGAEGAQKKLIARLPMGENFGESDAAGR